MNGFGTVLPAPGIGEGAVAALEEDQRRRVLADVNVEDPDLAQHDEVITGVDRQSIQPSAPSRMGAPDGAGCHGTPANLSPPETANLRHRSWWLACSTLMQK